MLEPDFSMNEEVDRNWGEITHKWYKFDRFLLGADMLKSITLQEVCDWLRCYTHFGENYRKLTIKVIKIFRMIRSLYTCMYDVQ